MDRGTLVAIFDIEAFSERSPEKQEEIVNCFLSSLSSYMERLSELHPDRFSTGDGAIVAIGRNCDIDAKNTKRFLDSAIAFTAELCGNREVMAIRTAVNYSQGDRLVLAPENLFNGPYVQVGDTINIAARVLSFCEPCEIMVTDRVRWLLWCHGLLEDFPLHHNEPLTTKHGVRLDTYTYNPPDGQAKSLYSPDSALHRYKRFTSVPSIQAGTLRYFLTNRLETELYNVVFTAHAAIGQINDTRTFLSSSEVLHVLTLPNYDPDDTVFVMSRNDRPSGFWTQKRRRQYLTF